MLPWKHLKKIKSLFHQEEYIRAKLQISVIFRTIDVMLLHAGNGYLDRDTNLS